MPETTGRRTLKSDVLMVKPVGSDGWIQFRDVFEVDGKPVHDRDERLLALFLDPTTSTATRARQIMTESARYNIGNVSRTINLPVLGLLILDPSRQARSRFRKVRARNPTLRATTKLADVEGLSVVSYEERGGETLIRTTGERDLPSHGRFWIEPSTGRVLMSEVAAWDGRLSFTIDVVYQPALTKLLAPAEMRERYENRIDSSLVEGSATYGKFRQFQVKVDEKIAPIKEKW